MKIRLHWGAAVTAAYLAFATGTMAFVVFALRRPVDLVSPDYYAASLRQDRQMDAMRNARNLRDAASVMQSGARVVTVSLPAAQASAARGTVTLYRASNASEDRVVTLAPDVTGHQQVSLDGLTPGLWSVRVRWTAQGRDFYLEQRVFAQ
jgi:hypothetical protein